MKSYLIKNATIVNEGKQFVSDLLIENGLISKINESISETSEVETIDATGLLLLPGCIDDQVHFREPGLTHKGTVFTESRAAVAGGITSFMEMPNTVPNALTQELLQDKYDIGAKDSIANYSFFMGASNDNLEEVLKTDGSKVCGIKIFMGSSTGNMLVDNIKVLENIFKSSKLLIATHCEDETTIRRNLELAKEQFGENVPISQHPIIRSADACYLSSSKAVELAKKHGTRLHVLHISTAKECELFDNKLPLEKKLITAEACIHHLWFSEEDYISKGNWIKWNPAVKSVDDRNAIWRAVLTNKIDVIATDHAPHTKEEKQNTYFNAPSGGPLVQHALIAMLDKVDEGIIAIERVVEKMAHNPAILFRIENRGFIREGFAADLVLVNPKKQTKVTPETNLAKCGWSPFDGHTFTSSIEKTFVNGNLVWNENEICSNENGMRLSFNR